LIDRLANRAETGAWGQFVDLYAPMLLAWCQRIGLSQADTADLTQTVFMALYEKLPEFRYDPSRSFRAWLETVMMNAWRNQVRQNKSRAPNAAVILDPELLPLLSLERTSRSTTRGGSRC